MPLLENLRRDTVAKLLLRPAISATPQTKVRDAVSLMVSGRSGCLLVEENGKLVGIFTERDLLKRVIGNGADWDTMIQSVMTPNPTSARMDEPIDSVLRKFRDGGYRHLPVVNTRGAIAGRVSVRELVHYMVEHFPKAVYNLPPKPDQVHAAPDGA